MSRQVEMHAGPRGPVVRLDVPVQLRLSVRDRVRAAVRWVLWLVGLVVVLWFGAAFLTATPASAAVPAAVAAQGLVKGGKTRPAGGKDGSDESGQSGADSTAEPKSANGKDKSAGAKPGDKPADKKDKSAGDKPADKKEKSADAKPGDKPADKKDKPAEAKPADKPADKEDKPAQADKPADKKDKSAEAKPGDKPADKKDKSAKPKPAAEP